MQLHSERRMRGSSIIINRIKSSVNTRVRVNTNQWNRSRTVLTQRVSKELRSPTQVLRKYHVDKQYNILDGALETNSETFKSSMKHMSGLVQELRSTIATIREGSYFTIDCFLIVCLGGGKDAVTKHLAKKKLLPRERINRLLDPG
jgi:hypothetical protein